MLVYIREIMGSITIYKVNQFKPKIIARFGIVAAVLLRILVC